MRLVASRSVSCHNPTFTVRLIKEQFTKPYLIWLLYKFQSVSQSSCEPENYIELARLADVVLVFRKI